MSYYRRSNGQKSYRGAKKARVNLVADFETTTDPHDCRVWAWGLSSVDDPENDFEWGKDLISFLDRLSEHNSICHFHNLKFDAHFIIDWLLKNEYEHVISNERISEPGTFQTLISDMGKMYSMTVRWKNGHNTEFRDSHKKLPMSVKHVATSFNLPESKGEIDYDAYRPIGWDPTGEELDYLKRDVVIVAKAMKTVFDNGMTKLTVASDSLAEYKRLITPKAFSRIFPVLSERMDDEIRRAYRGGWTYNAPMYSGKVNGSGLVLDVNSLYPYVMADRILPHGEPQWVPGIVETSAERPLTIFSITFTATIKPDHVPCIQIKGSSFFIATKYLTHIEDPVTMMVTNVDWELYNEHYDIDVVAYGGGWRFKAAKGMFDSYIDKWSKIKAESTGGQREIAKLHLNSLYGKFASNPNVTSKYPVLKDDAVVYRRGQDEKRPPVYTAVGVFITSYARDLTIRAAQANYGTFAYADTDSLHLLRDDVPETIDVHPTALGAWKLEYHFEESYYIRPKAYLEKRSESYCGHETGHPDHGDWCTYVNRIAGLPEAISSKLTFDDLVDGKVLHGKLNPKSVPGGVVLKEIPFELKL